MYIYDLCFKVIGSLYLVMMILVVLFSFVQGMCVSCSINTP